MGRPQQPPYFRIVTKTLYTAECVHCGRDIFEDGEYVAWVHEDSVSDVIDAGEYWRCTCGAPLSSTEAELLAEDECDEPHRWEHRDPPADTRLTVERGGAE